LTKIHLWFYTEARNGPLILKQDKRGLLMTVTLRVCLLLFLLSIPALAQKTQPRPPIIDVHFHAHRADRFGKVGLPNPVTGKPSAATTDDALLQAALAAMRRYNIVKAFASSHLDSVERWRAAAPALIVGGAQIDRGIPTPEVSRLRQDFLSKRLEFLGEVGAQYLGLSPADATLEPYFALAEELDVPVAIHTGISAPNTPYECCPDFRTSLGDPRLLEEVLIRHPKLRVNLMHAGYPYLQNTIAIMSVYPQVYADLGAIDWLIPRAEFQAYLQALVRAGFGKRIMFGSDQMIWPEAIGMAIEGVESAKFLTHTQKRDIFYNNAVRFFRLGKR
jgi:predicted TIM-barrel fold metal-dependent hydrolase